MMELVIGAVFFLPPVLLAGLGKTKLVWFPGAALLVMASVAYWSVPDTHNVIDGMAAWVARYAAVGLFMYGVMCLFVAALVRAHMSAKQRAAQRSSPAVEAPPGTDASNP